MQAGGRGRMKIRSSLGLEARCKHSDAEVLRFGVLEARCRCSNVEA